MSQVPIPTDWDGTTWCCKVIEWPKSDQWVALLRGLITWPQRGRFWDGATGTITDAQSVGREIYETNVLEGCALVGCLDDLVVEFQNMVIAVYATGTCGGSAGAGVSSAPAETFVDTGSNFPTGYTDRDEYSDIKCNLAQRVLDQLDADLEALKLANISGQSATAVAALLGITLLTPIPLDELLVAVAAALLGLVAFGISAYVNALGELQSRLDAMDLCELYEADDVDDAVAAVEAWIDGGSYTYQSLTEQLGSGLVGTNSVNILFAEKSDDINYDELPVGDCSSCVCDSTIFWGTGDPEAGGTLTSGWTGNYEGIGWYVSYARNMTITLTGWTSPISGDDTFRICSMRDVACGDNMGICYDIYSSDSNPFPTTFNGVGRTAIISATPFTLNVTYS